MLIVIATFVLALVAASGFLTVGVLALVGQNLGGHPSEYGLLLGIAGVAEVLGALIIARLRVRTWPRTAVLAWALLGAFRLPLGLATSFLLAAGLLAVTGLASALTDIPLIALVQQRIPDCHLAKAFGLWEAGIAGAIAIAPIIATAVIDQAGLQTGFMLSGAALSPPARPPHSHSPAVQCHRPVPDQAQPPHKERRTPVDSPPRQQTSVAALLVLTVITGLVDTVGQLPVRWSNGMERNASSKG